MNLYMDAPRNSAAQERNDFEILCNSGLDQSLILTKIRYYDHNGNQKRIPAAIYDITYESLPCLLPTLLPPPAELAYCVRKIKRKGKGLVATRNIAEGEIVIVERPVLLFPHMMIPPDSFGVFQEHAKRIMDPDDLRKYNKLKNVLDIWDVPGLFFSRFLGIALTNGFGVELVEGRESYCGVFPEMGRINHSCGPNLVRSWNPYLFAFTVRAARPIKAREELTLCYENMAETHENRRDELESKYKFDCNCGYCTDTSPTSDEERAQRSVFLIASHQHKYDELVNPKFTHSQRLRKAEDFRDFLLKDMAWFKEAGTESMSLMWHYMFLMKTCGLFGDMKWFKIWGFKALLDSVSFTDDEGRRACLYVAQWIKWIQNPTTFPGWGSL